MAFLLLPVDILKIIFTYPSSLLDIFNLRLTCKQLSSLVTNNVRFISNQDHHNHRITTRLLYLLPKLEGMHANCEIVLRQDSDLVPIISHPTLNRIYMYIPQVKLFQHYINLFFAEIDTRYLDGKKRYNYFFHCQKDDIYFQIKDGHIESTDETFDRLDLYRLKFPLYSYDGGYALAKQLSTVSSLRKVTFYYEDTFKHEIIQSVEEYDLRFTTLDTNTMFQYGFSLLQFMSRYNEITYPQVKKFYPIINGLLNDIESIFPNLDSISILVANLELEEWLITNLHPFYKYKEITFITTTHRTTSEIEKNYVKFVNYLRFKLPQTKFIRLQT